MLGNEISLILDEAENLMCDILLSGYHSVRDSSMERLSGLETAFAEYGMEKGANLIKRLSEALAMRRGSFDYDKVQITGRFCAFEFYLRNAKSRLD